MNVIEFCVRSGESGVIIDRQVHLLPAPIAENICRILVKRANASHFIQDFVCRINI